MKGTFTLLPPTSKNLLLLTFCVLGLSGTALHAQLSGTKNIPGDYATIALAVADLNAQGVGAGGVIFNVAAGYTETITATISLTATGTAANPITFQKSGMGANPVITAYTGGTATPASATQDGIFRMQGSDYVTIDGINLAENAANTANPATMEYGYALYKASTTDGCQFVTIKNCTITLNRINNASGSGPAVDGSRGIDMVNATATAATTALTITAASGSNSNNKFYSNTIQNCNIGIAMIGFADVTPFSFADTNNDVGGASAATGNTIKNYGGGGSTSPAAGIRTLAQYTLNISYNTINNNDGAGVNHPSTLRGIYTNTATSAGETVTFNTVTVKGGGTTSQVAAIENVAGSTAASNTINISNNTITGCTYTTATSGVFYGIYNNGASPATFTASNNTFSNNSTAATSGSYYVIYNTGSVATTINASNNSFSGTSFTAAATSLAYRGIFISSGATAAVANINSNNFQSYSYSGTASGEFTFIYASAAINTYNIGSNTFTNVTTPTTTTCYMIYNSQSSPNTNITNNSIVGSYTKSGAGGTQYGYYNFGTPSSGTATISGNTFSNITLNGATTFYGIYQATSTSQIEKVQNNTISNVTGGSSTLYGIFHNYGAAGSEVSGNTVSNFTGTSTINGIQLGSSTGSLGLNVFSNNVNTLSTTGAATVTGILHSLGTATNIYKNKIYNLQASNASGVVSGLTIAGGTTITAYNNLIGDLRTPTTNAAIPLTGINVSGSTTANLYHNTVYLNASSSGALFGSAAIYASTTPTLTMRNNIFVNLSTPNGATGFTAAYRRTGTTLTTYANASDNNLFFAGGICANRLIFYDGTNSDQTLAAYKTRVTPRDAASVTEDPQFVSTSGASANFLHINTAIATQIEKGAVAIGTVTEDYDGDVRGATPDIGADEFAGTQAVACAGTPVAGTAAAVASTICSGQSTTICVSGQTAAAGVRVQWQSSATPGGPYVDINCAGANCLNTGALTPGTYYYVAKVICDNSGLNALTNEVAITVNASPTAAISPATATVCLGSSIVLTASGGTTYLWSTTATTAAVTVSPVVNTTYTVTVSDAIGCTGTATKAVTVNPAPVITATASPTTICNGASSNLSVSISNPDYSATAITYAPVTIPSSGATALVTAGIATVAVTSGTLDDGYWSGISIPFTFNLYGTNYSTVTIGTNGNIHFGTSTTGGYSAGAFPNTTNPNATIAGVFADLDLRDLAATKANLTYFTDGSSPNRRFVVDYTNAGFYNSGSAQTSFASFQIILYESTNYVEVHTTSMDNTTANKIQGIENAAGTAAATVTGRNYTTSWSGMPDAYRFSVSATYAWTPATFLNNTTISNPVASNVTATTVYTVAVTGANGCSTTASVTVTVNPNAAISVTDNSGISLTDGIICVGGSATLTASGGTSYAWNTGATTAAITVSPTTSTPYTVVVTDAGGCVGTVTRTITVNPLPTAGITETDNSGNPNDNGVCPGGSATLTGTGGTSYAWSTGASTASITVSPAVTTDYTVTVTDGNGCVATASKTITVNGLPAITLTPQTATMCQGSSVSITATGGGTYSWSNGQTTNPASFSPASTSLFTVTVTSPAGCTASTTDTVTVWQAPVLSAVLVQPSTCASPTGSIDLTVTGAPGPFTYNWFTSNGSGLVNGQQDQSGLTVGTYNVTVTDQFYGCTSTASYSLSGPGGCDVCPMIGSLTSNPSGTTCKDASVTLTASGLMDMGVTYGITFRYFTGMTPPADPYTSPGGTDIGTVTNANLGNGGTTAQITTSFNTANTYYIYAILSPLPTDPQCRPSATTTLVVNPVPQVNAVASQTYCAGSSVPSIVFTSNVPGAVFNWSRTNENIGLGTNSGTGNVPAFTATNSGTAPLTATFSVVASYTNNGVTCTGTPIQFTITVNPNPQVNAVANQSYCNGSSVPSIVFTSNVPGAMFNWSRTVPTPDIGLAQNSGTGNVPAFTASNNSNAPTTAVFSVVASFTNNGVTCTGTPIQFNLTVNPTPNAVATPAAQTICSGNNITTIVLSGNVANTTFNWTRDNTASVSGIAANGSGNISGQLTSSSNVPVTVTFTITPTANGCPGTPITATVLVNPTPNVVATPASQTICSGSTITTIVLTGGVAGSTYNWTRNNTVQVTGIAANGTGNISGALTNTTNAPITVTFTITPTANNCPGTAINATVLVNPSPQAFALTGGGAVCTTDIIGVPVGLSGSQTNVNYQLRLNGNNVGAPVAGTGAAISFGTQLGIGTYTVLATHTQGGCTTLMTGSVSIASFNCTVAISDPCVCKNNATTLFNGQFDETIKVNAPSSQVWTILTVNGLYNQFSPIPPSNPVPLPAGAPLSPLGGNMFQLKGIHVDAIGYTVTVTNGLGTTLTIGNSCSYPNPSITTNFPPEICLFSDPIPLTGNPGDANIVSQTFRVNGVVTNVFNPSQGTGQYTIVYTVDGGVPKAAGPNDPGCIQSVSTFVNVVVTPSNLVCNDQVYVSLDADCTEEVLPDDVLEGSYGCYDDYYVEIDRTLPLGDGPWTPGVVSASDIGKNYQVRVIHKVSGNKCWGNLKVEDKLPPVLSCENFSIPCNTPNVTPNYLKNVLNISVAFPGTTDCQAVTLTYLDTETPQNCASGLTSTIFRKWTATDASGNTSTCIQQIGLIRPTLNDVVTPPDYDDIDAAAFHCGGSFPIINGHPNPTPEWIESQGLQGHPYIFGLPSGCSINWEYHDFPIIVCDGTVKYRREWTIVDWCIGNGFIYNQIIKVVDDAGPAISCPANMTVSTDPFACCATVNLPDVIVEDHCSRINNISGMIVVRDAYTGNVTNMVSIGGSLLDFPGNNHWDLDTLAAFGWTSCLPAGTHTVTYIAEDDCGNTSQCSFDLTVRDYTPPVASCDQTTTVAIGVDDPNDCYTSADGCAFAGVTWVKATTFDDGSYDNCNGVKFTVRRMEPYSDCILSLNDDHPCYLNEVGDLVYTEQDNAKLEQDSIKFFCCEVGTTQTVILAVYQTDVNGNIMVGPDGTPIKNECMIQVEVQDKLKPVCLSPANVSVNCENFDPSLWAYGKPVISDNCCLDTSKVYQGQCGLTHSVNYSLFDTVCNKGTITRTFRAFDCHGFSSQCTQRVFVSYDQDYFVKFPNDVIVTVCDGSGVYGEPIFFGEDCELLGVSFEDEVFTVVPDACFKIERTWTIINWCTFNPNAGCIYVPNPNPNPIANAAANLPGPTVSECGTLAPWKSTVVKINPTDPAATDFCTFWDKNANCYKYKQIIKVIDGQAPIGTYTVPACSNQNWLTPNNAQLWNEMYWWDNTIGSHDLCEEPTDLTITGTDACSGSNINIEYLLFLDLDGDGVMETVVNSVNTGLAGLGWNNVLYNNLNTPNFQGGTARAFDERPVPQNQKYGFAIQETVAGNNKTASVRFNTQQQQNTYVVPELPHGTHKIKWFLTDGCGNNKEYEYTFTVKDCKAPTVVCLNGLSVNIMPTGMITLWASDFLQYTEDNCTPAGQLKIAIRKCGQGTGFPVDAQGNPITSVTFTCAELGTQCVELWSIDAAGNADYCETYVIVQDNLGNCIPGNTVNVAGALKTENSDGVEESLVNINGASGAFNFSDLSDANGVYQVLNSVPMASSFVIAPEKDDNPLNGVTTYDLVLISKHILGLEPLNTPYKMIAADANKSGSITTFDIVELRKLVLGIYNELPNNTSWRFVDKSFTFPTPNNPFSVAIPEVISVSNALVHQTDKDFVAVKIGDVNSTAVANATMEADDRTNGTAIFDLEDRVVKAGEEFEVNFKSAQALQGFQFTATLNGLKAIATVDAEHVSSNNFNLLPENAMAVSIDGAQEFTVRFRAEKSGKLSEMLGVSGSITRAEAYGEAGRLNVAFRFGGKTIAGVGFELYQNQPNPFVNKTFIGFFLPQAAEATLSVFDETGRVVYQQKGQFAKGENSITLDRALLNTTGVLYYKLETATDSATRKMIQAK